MSISRAGGSLRHLVGEALEVVGGLAHRRDDDHDVVAAAAGAHDVLGDGADAVGVGDRRAAELLHEQAHDAPMVPGRPLRSSAPDSASVDSPAVPKATKRERQRQNRDARRAGDAGGGEAPEAQPDRSATSALLLIPLVIIFVILQLDQQRRQRQQLGVGDDRTAARPKARRSPTTHDPDRGAAR